MKTALVLSGGGFKGAFQAGALKYIYDKKIKIDLVVGVSAGALNGAMFACGKNRELDNMWNTIAMNGSQEIYDNTYAEVKPGLSLKGKEIYKYFFKDQNPLSLLTKGGRARFADKLEKFNHLTTASGLSNKLNQISINNFKIPFLTGAVSLNDGELHFLSSDDFLQDEQLRLFIEASATMPIIAKPIEQVISKSKIMSNLVDGGIKANVPLSQTIQHIRNTGWDWNIIVISCASNILAPQVTTNLLSVGLRALSDITINRISQQAYDETELINKLVESSGKDNLDGYQQYPMTIISPSGYDIGDTLDSSKEIIKKRMSLGYDVASKKLAK